MNMQLTDNPARATLQRTTAHEIYQHNRQIMRAIAAIHRARSAPSDATVYRAREFDLYAVSVDGVQL